MERTGFMRGRKKYEHKKRIRSQMVNVVKNELNPLFEHTHTRTLKRRTGSRYTNRVQTRQLLNPFG